MKTFNELQVSDQLHLCVEIFRAMLAARAQNISHAAQVREETPGELWRQICHEVSLEECEPWMGYPNKLLPTENGFWTRLALRPDDDVKRRVRGLQDLMLACLGSPSQN